MLESLQTNLPWSRTIPSNRSGKTGLYTTAPCTHWRIKTLLTSGQGLHHPLAVRVFSNAWPKPPKLQFVDPCYIVRHHWEKFGSVILVAAPQKLTQAGVRHFSVQFPPREELKPFLHFSTVSVLLPLPLLTDHMPQPWLYLLPSLVSLQLLYNLFELEAQN